MAFLKKLGLALNDAMGAFPTLLLGILEDSVKFFIMHSHLSKKSIFFQSNSC